MTKAWSGRFRASPAAAMEAYSQSVDEDQALVRHDVAGSIAHVHALEDADLLAPDEAEGLREGLRAVHEALQAGEAHLDPAHEDVHMNVEALLEDQVGDLAGKLHAGRSRNDQVALDLALWTRETALDLAQALAEAQEALLEAAADHADTPAAGETHGRPAQPLPFGVLLEAHAAALGRDAQRALAAADAASESPLGAGALAGTTLPVDPTVAADLLAFCDVRANPADAVAARDFAADLLHAATQAGAHLAGLGDQLADWSHPAAHVATLPEAYTTGSSLMPHKANPDAAELLRAGAGPVGGAQAAHAQVLAGLPAGYHRDLQEAKALLLDAVPPVVEAAGIAADLVDGTEFHPPDPLEAAGATLLATDLAEALVEEGVPFRDAHEQVGALVRDAEEKEVPFQDLARKRLDAADAVLDVHRSLARRTPHAAPADVQARVADTLEENAALQDEIADLQAELDQALEALLEPGPDPEVAP